MPSQPGRAAAPASTTAGIAAARVSATRPTRSPGRAGLRASTVSPAASGTGVIGLHSQTWGGANAARPASISPRSAALARSQPFDLTLGEKFGMPADGCVDAAPRVAVLADDLVKRLAHAVQTLKFERRAVACHIENRCHGMGVVGGELGVDAVGVEEPPRAGEVRDIRVRLAGEDRVAFEPHHLRALDLGVPVGA